MEKIAATRNAAREAFEAARAARAIRPTNRIITGRYIVGLTLCGRREEARMLRASKAA